MQKAINKPLKLIEVAELLGIPKRTLYDMIEKGRFATPLPGIKPLRWTVEEIERWCKHGVPASTDATGG